MPAFSTKTIRRTGAHRAATKPRLRFASLGVILTSTVIIGGAAFLGVTGMGGTYATWNGSTPVAAPTISSGSMALAVGVAGSESATYSIPSTTWMSLLPGDSVSREVSVKTTNSPSRVKSDIYVKLDAALPAGFEIRVMKDACTGTLVNSALLTTDTLIDQWGASQQRTICVQVSLRTDAANSLQANPVSVPVQMTLTAKQK